MMSEVLYVKVKFAMVRKNIDKYLTESRTSFLSQLETCRKIFFLSIYRTLNIRQKCYDFLNFCLNLILVAG